MCSSLCVPVLLCVIGAEGPILLPSSPDRKKRACDFVRRSMVLSFLNDTGILIRPPVLILSEW